MPRPSKGSRHNLGEPWASKLADFSAAMLGAPEANIIRAALNAYIDGRLENEPEIRRLYEEARDKRLAANGKNVTPLRTNR
jgi:hypothetical protein